MSHALPAPVAFYVYLRVARLTAGVFSVCGAFLYGTFPRVLGKYTREEKIIPIAEAVKKMTSMPAEKFGISGRGRISGGYFADIVVFNPDTVIDRATFTDPHQYPAGIPLFAADCSCNRRRG